MLQLRRLFFRKTVVRVDRKTTLHKRGAPDGEVPPGLKNAGEKVASGRYRKKLSTTKQPLVSNKIASLHSPGLTVAAVVKG